MKVDPDVCGNEVWKERQRHFDVAYGGYLLPTMDGRLTGPIICIKYEFH